MEVGEANARVEEANAQAEGEKELVGVQKNRVLDAVKTKMDEFELQSAMMENGETLQGTNDSRI